MRMMRFLLWSFLSLALPSGAATSPNIVFILADDLGIGDVKCYGGEDCLIETPNLDAMAEEGMRFTDAHVNASICAPTRRALMTGRYNWRFGAPVHSGPWGFVGPRPNTERFTLGKLMQQAGYRTGYVGKWHLGTLMETTDGGVQGPENTDFERPIRYGPKQFGFDESFILPGSLDMFPYAFLRNHEWQGEITAQKGWSAFNRIGPAERDFEDHEVLETFYREAEDYIGLQKEGESFFLFLSLTAPHTPTSPGVDWQGRSALGVYGDFVMEVDHAVERVMTALKTAGLAENTLVLFSSDHGPASYAGNILEATPAQIRQLEARGHHSNGPHRGYKFSIYEGGLRVPLLAWWPGVVPAGSTSDALVGLCDLMATFAELTGLELAADQGPDSISFASELRAPGGKSPRTHLVMESPMHFAIRDGDWKLCLTPSGGSHEAPTSAGNDPMPDVAWRQALSRFEGDLNEEALLRPPFVQLYDLGQDPAESRNLAERHPQQVGKMVEELLQQVKRGRSTPGPALENDKEVKVVNLRDRRLPEFVRQRAEGR